MVNDPRRLDRVLAMLREIQADFNDSACRGRQVSLADVIVIGGAAAVEQAAADAGVNIVVPVTPGRGDATVQQTDVESFALLEPTADAFRNYYDASEAYRSAPEMLVDKAEQLQLTVPEMTALLGGLRGLSANTGSSQHGVLTQRPGALTNDFFLTLLDRSIQWRATPEGDVFEGVMAGSQDAAYTATSVDLVFGAHPELRAVAEVYAYEDGQQRLVKDFVSAWTKVMNLDRFDLAN